MENHPIPTEPTGETYRRLLELANRSCTEALLVVHPRDGLSSGASDVLASLAPHRLSVEDRSSWPGTTLAGRTAEVHTFRFDGGVGDLLGAAVDGLYAWQQPDRPEDLCLLRHGEPWLVTVAHQGAAHLVLTPEERARLDDALPELFTP
ncbi:MAG: hypothetical protein JWO68_458 [Actinomycetia bacterium]|nr:hypothetical protein [Actinomycetes bacterium]